MDGWVGRTKGIIPHTEILASIPGLIAHRTWFITRHSFTHVP